MNDVVRKLTTGELVAAKPSIEEFRSLPRFPIHVVCDNIRSLENVGLIFRLSDAARIAHLHLCGITGYPALPSDDPRPPHVAERAGALIGKTAINTVEYVPWSYDDDVRSVVNGLRSSGTQIVALEQTLASVDYTKARYRFPICLMLGHEREGIDAELLGLADLAVQIPMYGIGNSLNVAMAYGILVYELIHCCVQPAPKTSPIRPQSSA